MRKLLALLAVILLASPGVKKAGAAEVTVDLFYRSLEPHGAWIETSDYGYVWRPREVAENWRPYTVGNWAYTDAGWTWVSEEPFGWATYHYGRWVRIEPVGWAWVPDTEWAPAWVSWRRSPKYVGWAPLPPEARFRKTVGIKSWADTYYDIGPEYYSFVEVREFGSPRLARVVVPPRENITIIRETKNITNITVVNNYVFNGGPEYEVIVRESAEPVRRLRIERRMDIDFGPGVAREDVLRAKVAGDTLRIVAPDVHFVANARPARVASRLDRVQVDRGWKMANVDQRQVEQLRTEMRKEAPKPPAELPPQPKFERAVANVSGDRARERRGGQAQAAESERLSVPGTPAGGAQPGATVGTPGTESAQPTSQPAKTDRMVPPAPDQTTATPAEGKEKDRTKRQKGKERQRPGATEAAPSAATPSATAPATAMPDATATPGAAPATTGETDRNATERDRAKRRGRTQPDGVTPGTAPETTAPGAASPTSETTTAEPGETGAKKKERAADRGKKRDRSQREQPGTPSTTTPEAPAPSAPEAEQPRKGREGRGARSAESPATARPEASEGSPSATMPSERPQTSRERRSPAEESKRPGREERPNRPQRDERPDRSERGAGRPEASASERGAGERSVERSQPRANAPREDGGSARAGKAERSQGGHERAQGAGERGGGRRGGAAGAEGAEAAGARER